MNFYHSWIYEYVINTRWFLWGMVIATFGLTGLFPVIFWFIFSGKLPPEKKTR